MHVMACNNTLGISLMILPEKIFSGNISWNIVVKKCEILWNICHISYYCEILYNMRNISRSVFPGFHHISPYFSYFTIFLLYSTSLQMSLLNSENPGIFQLVTPNVAKVRLPTLRRQATLAQRRSTEWTPFGFRARKQRLLPKGLREGLRIIQALLIKTYTTWKSVKVHQTRTIWSIQVLTCCRKEWNAFDSSAAKPCLRRDELKIARAWSTIIYPLSFIRSERIQRGFSRNALTVGWHM